MDSGKIVSHGKHSYLLRTHKKYATLYNKQKREKSKHLQEGEEIVMDEMQLAEENKQAQINENLQNLSDEIAKVEIQ